MTEIILTKAQYDAIPRNIASLPNRDATERVVIEIPEVENAALAYVRVTLDAGWGTYTFDVDLDGNSEQVNFGASGISIDAESYA